MAKSHDCVNRKMMAISLMSKKLVNEPMQPQDKYVLRFPDGLRNRVKAAAEANKRSMNAEIIRTLENAYPEPITIEEIAHDVQESLRMLKRFKGNATLSVLADGLDELLYELSKSTEGTEEDRKATAEHVYQHGKFHRFVPPGDF